MYQNVLFYSRLNEIAIFTLKKIKDVRYLYPNVPKKNGSFQNTSASIHHTWYKISMWPSPQEHLPRAKLLEKGDNIIIKPELDMNLILELGYQFFSSINGSLIEP